MQPKINVGGLSGKLGTGKDFIAKQYFFSHGFRQISLAWHFKVWVIGQGLATWEEVFETKPPHVRTMLQKLGTEQGRDVYGENIWVDTMFAWIYTYAHYWNEYNFIIPDVRFPNEVEGIQSHEGKVFRIHAPKRNQFASATDEQRMHPSETSLDNYKKFDGVIWNDPEDSSGLDDQMAILLTSKVGYGWWDRPVTI